MTREEFVAQVNAIIMQDGPDRLVTEVADQGNALVGMGVAMLIQAGVEVEDVVNGIREMWPVLMPMVPHVEHQAN